jgi:glycosyltransferase involved in cell wall biosynthesis
MKLLNLNPAFCMRAYRQLKALSERGFVIDLEYLGYGNSVKGIDDGFFNRKERIFRKDYPLSHFPRTLSPRLYRRRIERTVRDGRYDAIIVHNMPDILAVAAIRYSGLPVIFDERDMVTTFQKRIILSNYIPDALLGSSTISRIGTKTIYRMLTNLERESIEESAGRTWVSDYTYELAKFRYNVPERDNLMLYNYAGKEDIKPEKAKLSDSDGETHIVFEGVLSTSGYRAPLLEMFKRISSLGVHIHIYGLGDPSLLEVYKKASVKDDHFHFHGSAPHHVLMEEMTAFDWGIVPFEPPEKEREHFDTMLPMKFFDYLVSGLPVLAPNSRSMREFIRKNRVGRIYEGIDSIPELLDGRRPEIDRPSFTMEEHIDGLIDMIKRVAA